MRAGVSAERGFHSSDFIKERGFPMRGNTRRARCDLMQAATSGNAVEMSM
jgi:hypothetical protein